MIRDANTMTFDFSQIPILIVSMNRLECLKQQINWLEAAGYENITIIDNGSTYEPLLAFYPSCGHGVIFTPKRISPREVFQLPEFPEIVRGLPFVLTDPDIIPVEDCPPDAIQHFYRILERNSELCKVGFGLKIDDLPLCFAHRERVQLWEGRFWEELLSEDVFRAPIDTTFALYRQDQKFHNGWPAARTGGRYVARHTPWYINSSDLSAEESFYRATMDLGINSWNQTAPPAYTELAVDRAKREGRL